MQCNVMSMSYSVIKSSTLLNLTVYCTSCGPRSCILYSVQFYSNEWSAHNRALWSLRLLRAVITECLSEYIYIASLNTHETRCRNRRRNRLHFFPAQIFGTCVMNIWHRIRLVPDSGAELTFGYNTRYNNSGRLGEFIVYVAFSHAYLRRQTFSFQAHMVRNTTSARQEAQLPQRNSASAAHVQGARPIPPPPPLATPMRMVEFESHNVRSSSVPSTKRTLRWIAHSRSFKVILICAGRHPERCVVVMCN